MLIILLNQTPYNKYIILQNSNSIQAWYLPINVISKKGMRFLKM